MFAGAVIERIAVVLAEPTVKIKIDIEDIKKQLASKASEEFVEGAEALVENVTERTVKGSLRGLEKVIQGNEIRNTSRNIFANASKGASAWRLIIKINNQHYQAIESVIIKKNTDTYW